MAIRNRNPWVWESGSRAIQIIYRFHIHPAIRDRDDQIRMPEAQFNQRFDLLPINQLFANKIGTRYTQMDAPLAALTGISPG